MGEVADTEAGVVATASPERLIVAVDAVAARVGAAVCTLSVGGKSWPPAITGIPLRLSAESTRPSCVAVTRAKDQLYLTYPVMHLRGHSTAMLQPSRFVQELDDELYEEARVEERWV